MRMLAMLLIATGLGGCILVTDEHGRDHYVPAPHPPHQPPRPLPPAPPVYRLDCGFLATWNCWDQAVAEAEACAPATYSGRFGGVFDDYGHACYYPDGSAVFFDERVTVPLSPYHLWSFTMEDPAGRTCGWFEETPTSLSIGTASGVVDFVVDREGISVTCQDGTLWFNRDPYALDHCRDAEWGAPGYWREGGRASSTFGLTGGNVPTLFSCGW